MPGYFHICKSAHRDQCWLQRTGLMVTCTFEGLLQPQSKCHSKSQCQGWVFILSRTVTERQSSRVIKRMDSETRCLDLKPDWLCHLLSRGWLLLLFLLQSRRENAGLQPLVRLYLLWASVFFSAHKNNNPFLRGLLRGLEETIRIANIYWTHLPGTVKSTWHVLTHVSLTRTLCGRCYCYPHSEEWGNRGTERQVSCPRLHIL